MQIILLVPTTLSWGDLVGTIGDFSLFFFYPNRQVASIEGAAIAFRNSKFRLDLERLRKYGINQEVIFEIT